MPATQTSPLERQANITRVAAQAAEAALCHYAHANGVMFSDDQFAVVRDDLAAGIRRCLRRVDEHAD